MSEAGRICPLRYRYGPAAIARAATVEVDTLYVIGGLYGNPLALDTAIALASLDSGPVRLCFNGDFNWFDVDGGDFRRINETVLEHDATLGNVEAQFNAPNDEADCGCAYPSSVDAATVARSNHIHQRLKTTAARHPDLLAQLASLPMVARYRVGDRRVGVVHGDAHSLAGCDFDAKRLREADVFAALSDDFDAAQVDLFASSHTCLPICRTVPGGRILINNGAAGMPNVRGECYGVLSRIATTPAPVAPLYGLKRGTVHVDALALRYDVAAWQTRFLAQWPPGSAAHLSYFDRLCNGPDYALSDAAP